MSNNKSIQISLPCTGDDEWQAVKDPIYSGWLTQGPKVAEFERKFAERHHAKHGIATTSCTTGLHLILTSLGIGPGDEVIVPAFTWIATANVVMYCGATPVFVDVNSDSFNIDPQSIEQKLSPNTKAVIVVHLFGLCADMTAIRKAVPQNIPIIEDAACAAGAKHNGQSAGSLGEAGVFSFHPRKSITTGEGGMITTNNESLADTANMLRNHGASISEEQRHHGPKPHILPEFNLLGFNYRMTDMQGAVGLVQLAKLDKFISERQHWANFYREQLSGLDWLRTPNASPEDTHAWQAFVTFVDPQLSPFSRNEIMDKLQAKGVATRPGTHAVHLLGFYKEKFKISAGQYPVATECDHNTMAIPLHNRMTAEDYHYVVDSLLSLV